MKLLKYIADNSLFIIISFALAVLILTLEYMRPLLNLLDGSGDTINYYGYTYTSEIISKGLSDISDIRFAPQIAIALVWSAIAVVLYRMYLFIENLRIYLYNAAIMQHEYNSVQKHDSYKVVVTKHLGYGLAYLLFLVYAFLVLLPTSLSMGHIFANSEFSSSNIHYIVGAILCLWLTISVFLVSSRLLAAYERKL